MMAKASAMNQWRLSSDGPFWPLVGRMILIADDQPVSINQTRGPPATIMIPCSGRTERWKVIGSTSSVRQSQGPRRASLRRNTRYWGRRQRQLKNRGSQPHLPVLSHQSSMAKAIRSSNPMHDMPLLTCDPPRTTGDHVVDFGGSAATDTLLADQ